MPQVAGASIGPDVNVRLVGRPPFLEPGQAYADTIRITVGAPGVLTDLSLFGPGWNVVSFAPPPQLQLPANASVEIPIAVIALDPDLPLRFACDFNGRRVIKNFALSQRRARWDRDPLPLASRPGSGSAVPPGTSQTVPTPSESAGDSLLMPDALARRTTISVSGQVLYSHDGDPDDIRGPYGVLVNIYDDDAIGRNFLGQIMTQENGFFLKVIEWDGGWLDPLPDLYVEVRSENPLFDVRPGDFLGGGIYRWKSAVKKNFDGSSADFGNLYPADEEANAALHIVSTLTRAYSWMMDNGSSYPPEFSVQWPEAESLYRSGSETIHLTEADGFNDFVIVHEFGHHWLNSFAISPPPDYCNGGSEDVGSDCRHQLWCEENPTVAWTEGFPDWLGVVIPQTFRSTYGDPPSSPAFFLETPTSTCDGVATSPSRVEGFTAALLLDIEDPADVVDTNGSALYYDSFERSARDILDTVKLDEPTTALQFLDDFRSRFGSSSALWKTATSLGYANLDNTPPSTPAAIASTSHTEGVESADRTVDLNWPQADDDFSGVSSYSIRVASTAGLPDQSVDLESEGAATFYTTEVLAPGTWYVSVRARDRAGNWSAGYVSFGPIQIREAIDADLAFYEPGAAWGDVFTLRDDDAASLAIAGWTTTLAGDGSTWWNFGAQNVGDLALGQTTRARLYVDGELMGGVDVPNLAGGGQFASTNNGPITVRGGRHLVTLKLDAGTSQVSESDETNNAVSYQRVFEPSVLTTGTVVTRSVPPGSSAGSSDLSPGTILPSGNKDGVRVDGTASLWTITGMWTVDESSDYSLSLHEPSTGVTNGFGNPATAPAYSHRAAGCLDLVVSNQAHASAPDQWDIGISYVSGGGPYRILPKTINSVDATTVVFSTLDSGEVFDVGTFYLNASNLGEKSLSITTLSGSDPVNVAVFAPNVLGAALEDAAARVKTDTGGGGEMVLSATSVGAYCVVVWREPKDVDEATVGAVSIRIDVRPSSARLEAAAPVGWASSIMARPDATASAGDVQYPASLFGSVPNTYLSAAVANLSSIGAPGCSLVLDIDGLEVLREALAALGPGTVVERTSLGPITVRGGRHTVRAVIDLGDGSDPTQKRAIFREQFVWSPPVLPAASIVAPPPPPSLPSGSFVEVPSAGAFYFTASGHRVTASPSVFYGAAILPSASDDIDLRAHEIDAGVQNGFRRSTALSGWGRGESDFVILNSSATAKRAFDVGVLGTDASGSYRIEFVESQPLPSTCVGACGPYLLADDQIMSLHVLDVPPGMEDILSIHLQVDDTSTVDLGLSVYPVERPWIGKSEVIGNAISWLAAPGAEEQVAFRREGGTRFLVAVWRARSSGAAESPLEPASYDILVNPVASNTPPTVTTAGGTRLHFPEPNPFNPRTNISFEIDHGGSATLTIYDIRGRRVRDLAKGLWSSGRHDVIWDGTDDDGNEVTSGVYLVELITDRERQVTKAALVR